MNVPDLDGVDFKAAAGIHGYIVLGLIFGMPAYMSLWVISVRPELFDSWSVALAIGVAAVLICFTWLRAFRITITNGEIAYRTLFTGMHRMKVREIGDAKFVLEFNPWAHKGKPRNRLELYAVGASSPTLWINLKVFRRKDVNFLLQLFGIRKRPTAII